MEEGVLKLGLYVYCLVHGACLGLKRTCEKGMTAMDHVDTIDTLRDGEGEGEGEGEGMTQAGR